MRRDCQCEHQARNVKFDDSVSQIFANGSGQETVQNAIELLASKIGNATPVEVYVSTNVYNKDKQALEEQISQMESNIEEAQEFNAGKMDPSSGERGEIFNCYGDVTYSRIQGGPYDLNQASGGLSHAEGGNTIASGIVSHAEGGHTISSGAFSHAEGYNTIASGRGAHVEGGVLEADINQFQLQGNGLFKDDNGNDLITSNATGDFSHTEGLYNWAKGPGTHAGGIHSKAGPTGSFVHGMGLEANFGYEAVFGKWNSRWSNADFLATADQPIFVIGIGTNEDISESGVITELKRKDGLRLNCRGDLKIAGTYYDGTDKPLYPIIPLGLEEGESPEDYVEDKQIFYAFYER